MADELRQIIGRYFDALDRERQGRPFALAEVRAMYQHLELPRPRIEEQYRRASAVLQQNQIEWCTTFDPLPCEERDFVKAVMEEAFRRGYEPQPVVDAPMTEEVEELPYTLDDRARIDPDECYPLRGFREYEVMALRILDSFKRVRLARTEHVIELTFERTGLVCLVTADGYEMREPTLDWMVDRDERCPSTARITLLDKADDAIGWIAAY